jgi:hypothetical protein
MTERRISVPAVFGALIIGALIGGMAVEYWMVKYGSARPAATAAQTVPTAAADDVAQLKKIVPPQSHTMQDVGHHWTNLWFAVQKGNWPLATYYFLEGRQAMRWTMMIRPVRQMPGGGTIDVQKIFGVLDATAFAAVQLAVEDNDTAAFEDSYKKSLTACHSCHSQVGWPQLRPVVPTTPSSTILSFEK